MYAIMSNSFPLTILNTASVSGLIRRGSAINWGLVVDGFSLLALVVRAYVAAGRQLCASVQDARRRVTNDNDKRNKTHAGTNSNVDNNTRDR